MKGGHVLKPGSKSVLMLRQGIVRYYSNLVSLITVFNNMPYNVKVNILVLPLWSIPYNMVNPYTSLYMMEKGISATQIGLINSLGFILKTVFAIFAGYIINRFGRRFTLGILDFIGWAVPMLLFFLASEYWLFMAASLINCITVINGIAGQCFFVEDVSHEQRIHVFNYTSIVGSLCTLFTPLSGLFIKKAGFLPAMRAMFFFSFISMGMLAFCKLLFLRETSVGIKMKRMKREKNNNLFKDCVKTLSYILSNKILLVLLSVDLLINFAAIINNLYYFPYLTKHLGLSESSISFLPALTTFINMIIYFNVIAYIKNMIRAIILGMVIYSMGTFALIAAFFFNINTYMWMAVIACTVFWAVGNSIVSIILRTMIANAIQDEIRTDVLGIFNMISTMCMFPIGYFGGWLYELSGAYPVYFVFFTYLLGLLSFLLFYGRNGKRFENTGLSM